MTRFLVPALLSLALAGPAAATQTSAPAPSEQPTVIPVSPDLAPLKGWFNENRGQPRLIVLLSPT